MVEESGERKGFWGSTLSKLKTALSKTKSQIVGSIEEGEEGTSAENLQEVPRAELANDVAQSVQTAGSTPEDKSSAIEQTSHEAAPVVESKASDYAPSVAASASHSTATTSVQAPPQPVPKAESKPVAEESSKGHAVPIDEEYLEDLEEKLIKSDIGLTNVQNMTAHLKKEARGKSLSSRDVVNFLKGEFQDILKAAPAPALKYTPGQVNIYLVVGVNGTGKTTSIGKLSWRFKQEGKRVLMAAGDTFRAAAESQLEIWSERAGVDIVRLPDNADPGAVVFTAIERAKKENYDCLVIDTAGRLHNKSNLMAELGKIRGVVEKHGQGLPLECLLVLDASTGQNGLQQAKLFTEVCKLTGVILTKLDGTAKGGVVFSIARDLKIPVKLIGLGEQMDDLRDFEPDLFIEALF